MSDMDRIIQLGSSQVDPSEIPELEEQVNEDEVEEDQLEDNQDDTSGGEDEDDSDSDEEKNMDELENGETDTESKIDPEKEIDIELSDDDEDIELETENIKKTTIVSNFETYSNYYANVKVTSPILGKFERAKILGVRAEMLAAGAQPFISPPIPDNSYEVALRELKEKKIPLMIRRYLPNGEIEDWRLEDLIIR